MSGTSTGGLKAAKTNKEKYGKDFYKIQGAKGGRVSCEKGFASNRDLAKNVASNAGSISKRGFKFIREVGSIRSNSDNKTGKITVFKYNELTKKYELSEEGLK